MIVSCVIITLLVQNTSSNLNKHRRYFIMNALQFQFQQFQFRQFSDVTGDLLTVKAQG